RRVSADRSARPTCRSDVRTSRRCALGALSAITVLLIAASGEMKVAFVSAPTRLSSRDRLSSRRSPLAEATPLLLCNYFVANMDDWDPKVTNGFAAEHDVILFDYPGIGRSSGETPSTVAALTKHCVAFCRAIGLTQFNVIGFSLGGMIAQQLGAEYPD